jgi:hypothetical protein
MSTEASRPLSPAAREIVEWIASALDRRTEADYAMTSGSWLLTCLAREPLAAAEPVSVLPEGDGTGEYVSGDLRASEVDWLALTRGETLEAAIDAAAKAKYERRRRERQWEPWERLRDPSKETYRARVRRAVTEAAPVLRAADQAENVAVRAERDRLLEEVSQLRTERDRGLFIAEPRNHHGEPWTAKQITYLAARVRERDTDWTQSYWAAADILLKVAAVLPEDES